MLPFTREQFIGIFAHYNAALWPVQWLAYALGLAMITLVLLRARWAQRVVGAGLAAMWLWTGVVYHGLFFSSINPAAFAFGALFVLQAAVFVHAAVLGGRLSFAPTNTPSAWLGWALITYAGVAYPLIGIALGHTPAELPMFGSTPCPVTLFTLGLLLLAKPPVPRGVLVIPFVWSIVGGSAAFLLGVAQDWVLLLGALVVPLIVLRDWTLLRSGPSDSERQVGPPHVSTQRLRR
jgi:hypothetical protein